MGAVFLFPLAGQSNIDRYFREQDADSNGITGAERFDMVFSGLTGADVELLDVAVGGTPVDRIAADDADDPWWYDLDAGLPGPLLVDAVASITAALDALSTSLGTEVTLPGIVWAQGETDARSIGGGTAQQSTAERYRDATEAVFATFRDELGDPDLPIYIQQIGATTDPSAALGAAEVRAAQTAIAAADPHVHIAATTYDLALIDRFHYSGEGYTIAAERLANYIAEDLGVPGAVGGGPVIAGARFGADTGEIIVTLDHGSGGDIGPVAGISGFTATDATGDRQPSTAERLSATEIRLGFDAPLTGTVSLSYIRDANGWDPGRVVRDDSALSLPLEPGTVPVDGETLDPSTVLLAAGFSGGADGFTYADDAFGTAAPAYADGRVADGSLQVTLGGVDTSTVEGMSGGWTRAFSLDAAADVTLSFRYNLTLAAGYEPDESAQVLASLDGRPLGGGPLATLAGDGDAGAPISTGWQTVTIDLGTLEAGSHSLALGGLNTRKTWINEVTTLGLDDVVLTAEPADPLIA